MCVDDEPMVLAGLRDTLEKKLNDVCRVEATDSPSEALEILADFVIEGEPVAAVITDQNMPKISGDELLVRVHRTDPRIRTILLTGQASADAVGRALNDAGLYRYIPKPWDFKDLILTVKEAVLSWEKGYELETRVAMLQELQHNIRTLSQIMDPEALAKEILSIGLKKTSAEHGMLAFGGKIIQKDAYGDVNTGASSFPEAVARRAVEGRRYVGMDEMEFPQGRRPSDALCAPIFRLDQSLAVLYLEKKNGAFHPVVLDHLKLFLEQSAIFIENTLMYQKLNAGVEERTKALEKTERALSDSLAYAKIVQSALAPRHPEFADHFSDYFLHYRPGTTPGGDGYWLVSDANTVYFCVAEVTNPGLAAPFLALLGSTRLTEIVLQKRVESAGDILYFLHQKVAQMGPELGVEVGVNVALCAYDKAEHCVRFAGAGLPIVHIHGSDFDVYATDELPLGMNNDEFGVRLFLEGEFFVEPGDRLILATDAALNIAGNGNLFAGAENMADYFLALNDGNFSKQSVAQHFFAQETYDEDILVLGLKF